MRTRGMVLALVAVATAGVWVSACRSRARPDVVNVRWPATAPEAAAQDLLRYGPPEDAPDVLLNETEIAPGIRIREGAAHDLSYFELVLGDAGFDDPLPLVVLLHGRGDRPRIPGGPFVGAPTPMRLVIPRGPIPLGAGFAWMTVSITQGRPDLLARDLRLRTDHLAALIRTLSEALPTLGRPSVVGFSQGGMLAFSLALHRPDAVGRAFPLAGWLPPALLPTAPAAPEWRVPIRSLHGTEDSVIPVAPTREVAALLRALEWEVEFVEIDGVGHVVSPEMNAIFEAWLEEALLEEAPDLTGKGLGVAGPEDETYAPFEPLEPETIEAIEELEAQDPDPAPSGTEAVSDDASASDLDGDAIEQDGADDQTPAGQ